MTRLHLLEKLSARRGLYKCACGQTKTLDNYDVARGATRSCGCLQAQSASERRTTHGRSKTKIYSLWGSMIQRCTNPRNRQFPDYGGRGITICRRWRRFENFFRDMGASPVGRSLERRNNDQGYRPSNCYWATRGEQNSNTRKNRWLTHAGITDTLSGWARRLNIHSGALCQRLKKWPQDRALSQPRKNCAFTI